MSTNTITDKGPSASLLASVNGGKDAAKTTAQAAQDRFMTLLVTQMKNQDPLNPMDNAQMTSQLAQLSTVTGIDKLNATVESMSGNFQSNQTLQAAAMIGRSVLVAGSNTELSDGKALMGMELPNSADKVKINIKDVNGKVVHTLDMGPQEGGVHPLQWDGMDDNGVALADGKYTFEVEAILGGKSTTVNALEFGKIASVSSSTQGVLLNVPGKGAVSLTDVRQFL